MPPNANQPPSSARAAEARSPFVRLNDLLARRRSRANPRSICAVGEPQHPVPAFVGPVMATTYRRIRPLPHEQGHRAFPRSGRGLAGAALSPCRAPLDPENEVLVLNGTREGLFLAALAAAR